MTDPGLTRHELLVDRTRIGDVEYRRGDALELTEQQAAGLLGCGAVGPVGTVARRAEVDRAHSESRRAAAVAALGVACPDLDAASSGYARHLAEALLAHELGELEQRRRYLGSRVG